MRPLAERFTMSDKKLHSVKNDEEVYEVVDPKPGRLARLKNIAIDPMVFIPVIVGSAAIVVAIVASRLNNAEETNEDTDQQD